ncbi:hypothetical protein K435DRAFT_877058 [Dendrothele bispora CBS 962.96]|uniref:Uncharacterized protein n=1 Tax=Dendrothele bispora (strain CBS 962.96) TaxID=1314807 RepID=A0A4S8KQP3_DENBC|nr:hypothetical protein K435DRAFT_877058 [Dendrothele bispora CBS 962.96]
MYSFSVYGSVREMWTFDDNHRSDSSIPSWYILEIAPIANNTSTFIDVYKELMHLESVSNIFTNTVGRDDNDNPYFLICFPPQLALITTAEDVVIPPAPYPDHACLPFYDHWDNERKALTPMASVVIDFHVVVEQLRDKQVAILVAEKIRVLGSGLTWYSLYEDEGMSKVAQATT